MVASIGPPSGVTRNKPFSPELTQILGYTARTAFVHPIRIVSGGQDDRGEGTRRTGSTRHDRGRAADTQCVVDGRTLILTEQTLDPLTAPADATGIGFGLGYKGNKTIHSGFGFGTSTPRSREAELGGGGESANTSGWLRNAAEAGWAAPISGHRSTDHNILTAGRYTVIGRSGRKLRGATSVNREPERTFPHGTKLDGLTTGVQDSRWVGGRLGRELPHKRISVRRLTRTR